MNILRKDVESSKVAPPDRALIARAAHRLGEIGNLMIDQRIEPGPPSIRPHSVVWPLLPIEGRDRGVVAYYKRVDDEWMSQSMKEGFARSESHGPMLAAVLNPIGVVSARVLAVEADSGEIITGAVRGRQVRWWEGRSNRFLYQRPAFQQLRLLGLAVRIWEDLASPSQSSADETSESAHLKNDVARARDLGPRYAELPRILLGLFEAARSHTAFTHGDLSSTNVLAIDSGLGLIDFGWRVRYRGFDIACLSHRLECLRGLPSQWRRGAVAAVFEGYGELGVAEPGWRFYRMQRLLRMIARGRPHDVHLAKDRLHHAMRMEL